MQASLDGIHVRTKMLNVKMWSRNEYAVHYAV
jgi:hypothetical protein